MPLYRLRLEGREDLFTEEVPLPDAEAAWYQAVRSAHAIAAEGAEGCEEPHLLLKVEDELGQPVWDVPLQEIIRLTT